MKNDPQVTKQILAHINSALALLDTLEPFKGSGFNRRTQIARDLDATLASAVTQAQQLNQLTK